MVGWNVGAGRTRCVGSERPTKRPHRRRRLAHRRRLQSFRRGRPARRYRASRRWHSPALLARPAHRGAPALWTSPWARPPGPWRAPSQRWSWSRVSEGRPGPWPHRQTKRFGRGGHTVRSAHRLEVSPATRWCRPSSAISGRPAPQDCGRNHGAPASALGPRPPAAPQSTRHVESARRQPATDPRAAWATMRRPGRGSCEARTGGSAACGSSNRSVSGAGPGWQPVSTDPVENPVEDRAARDAAEAASESGDRL